MTELIIYNQVYLQNLFTVKYVEVCACLLDSKKEGNNLQTKVKESEWSSKDQTLKHKKWQFKYIKPFNKINYQTTPNHKYAFEKNTSLQSEIKFIDTTFTVSDFKIEQKHQSKDQQILKPQQQENYNQYYNQSPIITQYLPIKDYQKKKFCQPLNYQQVKYFQPINSCEYYQPVKYKKTINHNTKGKDFQNKQYKIVKEYREQRQKYHNKYELPYNHEITFLIKEMEQDIQNLKKENCLLRERVNQLQWNSINGIGMQEQIQVMKKKVQFLIKVAQQENKSEKKMSKQEELNLQQNFKRIENVFQKIRKYKIK